MHDAMCSGFRSGALLLAMTAICLPLLSVANHLTNPEPDYDQTLAKNFASLASTTYCGDVSKILDWSCGACVDSATPLIPGKIRIIDGGPKNATRVIVGKLKDQHGCLMAFRGSSNVQNWVTDFQFWEIDPVAYQDCEGCKVHHGFYKIWESVRDEVLAAIHDVGCGQFSPIGVSPDNLLYITGHSLGAALTHLAMFTLNDAGWNISKTYSFEAPRIGNLKFSQAFESRFSRKFPVYRLTHYRDPVVHLPPESFGYQHVPVEVFYDRHGNYTVCEDAEDKRCADRYGNIPGMLAFHSGDHCASPLVPNGDICNPKGC